jgi:flagellar biosynthesis/type III secretory pathway protein FliH
MGRIVKGTPATTTATATTTNSAEVVAALVRARADAKHAAVVWARKMAEKIVGHAVDLDAQIMRDIAAQALAAVKPGAQAVLLRVHPEDLAGLARERTAWLAELGTEAEVQLVADPDVGRYGCIVETAHGRLDARLTTQLDAMERALRSAGGGGG